MSDQPSSQHQPWLMAITGTRGVGKDTLCALLTRINPRLRRVAFADQIKEDLFPLIQEHLGFDVRTATGGAKEQSRPMLISWGMTMRARDPLHWVKVAVNHVDKTHTGYPSYRDAPLWCVVDCRFTNEVEYLRSVYPSFKLINVTRDGAPPPTIEEERHYRLVAAMADHHLAWGNDDEATQLARAREVAEQMGILPEEEEVKT